MDDNKSTDLTVDEGHVPQTIQPERRPEPTDFQRPRSGLFRALVFTVRGGMQLAIMVAVLVGATFLMIQLQESRKERPQRQKKEAVYTIETVVAEPSRNQPMISVYGEVVAGRMLNLTSLVPGEVVYVNPALRAGTRISKGDTLIEINRFAFEVAFDEAVANLNEAKAALIEAEARLEQEETALIRNREQLFLAQSDLARAKTLVTTGTLTNRDVETRELIVSQRKAAFQTSGTNINVQKAQIDARAATVERWGVQVRNAVKNLDNTVLTAPFDAVVQEVNVELRQTVATNQALITLYEADTLDARFLLSDGQYGRLISDNEDLVGRTVSVDWTTGRNEISYPATIDRVGAEILSNRGGVGVFARLNLNNADATIRPGAFVTVNVPDRVFDKTYRLPETAVFDGDIVYVVGDDNRLKAREVNVAVYDRDSVIIDRGLQAGDIVLTTQIAEVGEGLLVRLVNQEESAIGSDGSGNSKDGSQKSAKAPAQQPRG